MTSSARTKPPDKANNTGPGSILQRSRSALRKSRSVLRKSRSVLRKSRSILLKPCSILPGAGLLNLNQVHIYLPPKASHHRGTVCLAPAGGGMDGWYGLTDDRGAFPDD